MDIIFGLGLDGYESLLPSNGLNTLHCGPMAFLGLLETRLGLKSLPATNAERIGQYKALLEGLAKEREVFYQASLQKDSYAVAETLLEWRDDLIEAGWEGQASATDSPRLQDLAEIERKASGVLAHGIGDRIRNVAYELGSGSPGIDSLRVMEDREHLSPLWQRICDLLSATFVPAESLLKKESASTGSDLQQIQARLCSSVVGPLSKLTLKGDSSIVCLTAHSEYTLAQGVAQWLKAARGQSPGQTTFVAQGDARLLDLALALCDEPTLGLKSFSRIRPIPQVLLLALRLQWLPIDPRALLEFLIHPVCPVSSRLRHRLAKAVSISPGIGGPKWLEAIEEAKESVRQKYANDTTQAEKILSRFETDLNDWILVVRFDPETGAPGAVLSETCARVARWAGGRALFPGTPNAERDQFRALAALGSQLARLLCSIPTVTRSGLERMLHQVSATGWPKTFSAAELGHVHRATSPASVIEPVETVVWWNFSEPTPPALPPWTERELKGLTAHGVSFASAEVVAAREASMALRPLLAARRRIVLAWPREWGGVPVARHPLLARILALIQEGSPTLPTLDLDDALARGQGSNPIVFNSIPRRSLPPLRRWWRVNATGRLGLRDVESYSAVEKFLFSPYDWVLRYKAHLKAGPLSNFRLQEGSRQKGLLLHRLLDLVLVPPAGDMDWRTVTQPEFMDWLQRQWPILLEQEGANLLLPGQRADAAALLETGKAALWHLLENLRQAGVVEAVSNVQAGPAPFVGGRMEGLLDLLVTSATGETAVVDLKFGRSDVREKELRKNIPLQLAIYGYLQSCQHQDQWPGSAFYMLKDRRLLAPENSFFPHARVVTPKTPSGGIRQCWAEFEQIWRWRREQLNQGWVEITVPGTEPTRSSSESGDSTPPLEQWQATEDHSKYNDYKVLTGWRAEA